jgi:hypothetical protein
MVDQDAAYLWTTRRLFQFKLLFTEFIYPFVVFIYHVSTKRHYYASLEERLYILCFRRQVVCTLGTKALTTRAQPFDGPLQSETTSIYKGSLTTSWKLPATRRLVWTTGMHVVEF